MAEAITKKQIKQLPIVPYEKIRERLQTGDIFFCSGSYTFSGIIQRLTKSAWSHVAIVYKDPELGRILILEAEPRIGIRLIPISKYLHDYKGTSRPYKGQIVMAKLNIKLEHEKIKKAISFGLDELTRPYDNWEIVRIMTRILFRIGKREKNKSYICSELVKSAFDKAGVGFHMKDTYISPQEIWTDKRIEPLFRLL
ncbi:MAG TPA: YiiX/YebB-like N1pC/P60 family cysteine hydrolase [Chitinophagaceae bacterium]|nr:YiiX/YebB-like N1pC/P60 family cysteine hydrolase [Chitinophagaceae bacterium]HNJ26426.1 YiiX/YebB-like N1pC/P60 family cysteine hydrolase [Chitinophagaceae bacterium]HNJ56128.1 YiiX/YebB-like N1pC/P60 family cysteine hydrolase [Chitinophagaceae bacterium]HNL60035.1 YiiX/YebB-like N1pC/P60 family cysteine hydrolase [Chitinophagaceae bacterium]HNN99823.1 YiiX/YebB-like N1pC/P60 family cysteine hydrolase [Chitinophagaceae bacterium]